MSSVKSGVRFSEPAGGETASSNEHEISFGFLRCDSSYMMRLKADQHRLQEPLNVEYSESGREKLAVQIVGNDLEIILYANSPGKFSEFVICSNAELGSRRFHVKANVLPLNMGTPAIKDTVTCISKSGDQSDVSDWKGP